MDNIVIAEELIYCMDNKKGKMGFMAIKVDLEKAYDRLKWNFIHKVLHAFHFPHHLVKLIMSCISTTSISILVNGESLESFNPSRAILQGDPISPYIFILCMEYLGSLIEKECMDGDWVPIKASRENLEISHLFFVDDLILFAKASEEGREVIRDVLDRFCVESGKKVSSDKSHIYFSKNVKANLKNKICNNLQIQATNDLGKYLGFPIRQKGAARNHFNFVVERVMNKLSGWKAKLLSFASRTVLVKFVMSAIPNYVMQRVAFPIHLCDKLDKICRDFHWGSSQGKSKMHMVGWNKIINVRTYVIHLLGTYVTILCNWLIL